MVSSVIKQIIDNSSNDIYLHCQPITLAPPKDIPQISNLSKKLWSSKLIIQSHSNSITALSEWFSIPIKNIRIISESRIEGEFYIFLNNLNTQKINILFNNVEPVFKINNNMDKETINWLRKQRNYDFSS